MKICIAQTTSLKGNIQKNIKSHLKIIKRAITLKSDCIVFPELSIIGYEPSLTKELATNVEDPIFNPFQELSDVYNITIGVGMPIKATEGIQISMLILQPKKERIVYSKQILHSDEIPYFICGKKQTFLNINGHKIAVGICYETLQREHFLNAKQHGADLYIASVAKSKIGIEKANLHFSKISKELFSFLVLVRNQC